MEHRPYFGIRFRRMLSMLLAVVMLSGMLPASVFAAAGEGSLSRISHAAEIMNTIPETTIPGETEPTEETTEPSAPAEPELTRAQWLQTLVTIFSMEVAGGAYPDNYFSDLSSDSAYYYDMLLAVEFGVVDIEAGGTLRPEEAATREFAAQTLNHCLGFKLREDTEYTFAEAETVTYPDDIQVAVDRGWFALEEDCFLPDQAVTAGEAEFMQADALALLAAETPDESRENTGVLAEGVIEIPAGTAVEMDENGDLVIPDCPVDLRAGDCFVVYDGDFPVAFVATAVLNTSDGTVVTVTTEGTEDALTDFYYSGTITADLEDFVPAEATTYTYNGLRVDESMTTYGVSYNGGVLNASKDITLKDKLKATVDCDISSIKLDLFSDKKNDVCHAVFTGKMKSTISVHGDLRDAIFNDNYIQLGYVPILFGTAYMELALDFAVSGEIALVWSGDVKMGFHYGDGEFRTTQSFKRDTFSFNSQVTARLGLRQEIGIDLWVMRAKIWASIGAQMDLKDVVYVDDEKPARCKDYEGFLYMKTGASAKIFGVKEFSAEEDLFQRSNSPVRVHYHIEDDVLVSKCARGDEFSAYFTDPSSPYYNPSGGSVSSTYVDSSGNTVVVYTYTVNDSGEATITGYNGSAYTLNIPSRIDGYPVTAIGSSAFSGDSLGVVKIPEGVTSIGHTAFFHCTSLVSVTIPDTVIAIGNHAFEGCSKLTALSIPESVKSIGNSAFDGCKGLETITIPGSGVSIGYGAFDDCTNLKTAYIPDSAIINGSIFTNGVTLRITCDTGTIPAGYMDTSVYNTCTLAGIREIVIEEGITSIGDYAFKSYSRLTQTLESVTLPSSLETIGGTAFQYCRALKSIAIPEGITRIEQDTFNGCTALTEVSLPSTLTYLSGFKDCTALTQISIPDGVTIIGAYAFTNCSGLKEIMLPADTVTVEWYAFRNCAGLKSIQFNNQITTIEYDAFSGCSGLTEITLPDSVTSVGRSAFANCSALENIRFGTGMTYLSGSMFKGCTALESVTIPDWITKIHSSAFSDCTGLKTIYVPDSVEFGYNVFSGDQVTLVVTCNNGYIPEAYLYSGSSQNGPKSVGIAEIIVSEGITTIGEWAFKFINFGVSPCTIQKITLPESLIEIGGYAFEGCSSLTEINLPSRITDIPQYAFSGCSSLPGISIHDRIVSIGNYAFSGCEALTQIEIPDSVTTMGTYVFQNCTALEEVRLPRTRKAIEDYMFSGCIALRSIELPDMVTSLGKGAFQNCASLTEVLWPVALTSVGAYAFQGCTSLESIDIPKTVTTLGSNALENCSALTCVTIPETLTAIPASLFSGCTALAGFDISDQVTAIGSSAFQNCDALTAITIPDSVATLGNKVFYDCDALETVTLPDSVTAIGTGCFTSCDALAQVKLSQGLTTIPQEAFMDCPSITQVVIPKYVTTLQANAFSVCPALVRASVPASVTTISANAFSYPDRLVIRGLPGSYAETWAAENGFVFEDGTVTADTVALNRTQLTMLSGATEQLLLTVTPEDYTDPVEWKSSNTGVVTVSDRGVLTAVGLGTATIKVLVGDVGASCKVTVVKPVSSVKLDQTSLTLSALETRTLTASVTPTDAHDTAVLWTSSDPAVAAVDENGTILALSRGTAVITATAADGSGVSAVCTVTVTNTAYLADDPSGLESTHPYANSCSDFWVYSIERAESLRVTFDARTDLEDGFDFLDVYDGTGALVGSYTGTELAGQTIEIPGNTVRIQLRSDSSGTEWGFKVTSVVYPVETVASGWSGYTQWVLTDDGYITFSGEGAMKNYTYKSEMPWCAYADQITNVVIGEGVTSIGAYAFYGMDVESVEIASTVTSIGDYAFKNCAVLDNVVLHENLTSLGDSAFYGCASLTGIEIPASLWTIKPYTFKNCTALAEVTFHEGNLQKISDGAFYGTALTELVLPDCLGILDVYSFKNCSQLASITIGSGLTEIREAVFYGTAIPTITIPEGVTRIGPYAFKNCVELESIDLPASLTSIGEASFYACTGLKTVELPDAVTAIGNYAFRKCAAIETLTLGAELSTIGECSFYGCTGLTELVIPDKVTTIKPYAFKTCTGVTSVTLGSSVKTIGEGAFNTCTGLKTIVFPESLISIGDYCFSGSYNLWKLTFEGDAPAIGSGAFKGMNAYAYYPGNNTTWTADNLLNYGGKITWKAQ